MVLSDDFFPERTGLVYTDRDIEKCGKAKVKWLDKDYKLEIVVRGKEVDEWSILKCVELWEFIGEGTPRYIYDITSDRDKDMGLIRVTAESPFYMNLVIEEVGKGKFRMRLERW